MSDKFTVEMSGCIDENFAFPDLASVSKDQPIVLDLDKVEMINSLGIRSWVRWMKGLTANLIILKNIPVNIVHQINMIAGFLPEKAKIESFYAPFYCDSCKGNFDVLLQRSRDFSPKTADKEASINVDSERECELCGEEAELDAAEAKYFAFVFNESI